MGTGVCVHTYLPLHPVTFHYPLGDVRVLNFALVKEGIMPRVTYH